MLGEGCAIECYFFLFFQQNFLLWCTKHAFTSLTAILFLSQLDTISTLVNMVYDSMNLLLTSHDSRASKLTTLMEDIFQSR